MTYIWITVDELVGLAFDGIKGSACFAGSAWLIEKGIQATNLEAKVAYFTAGGFLIFIGVLAFAHYFGRVARIRKRARLSWWKLWSETVEDNVTRQIP